MAFVHPVKLIDALFPILEVVLLLVAVSLISFAPARNIQKL
jgi:hypothetical protein